MHQDQETTREGDVKVDETAEVEADRELAFVLLFDISPIHWL